MCQAQVRSKYLHDVERVARKITVLTCAAENIQGCIQWHRIAGAKSGKRIKNSS